MDLLLPNYALLWGYMKTLYRDIASSARYLVPNLGMVVTEWEGTPPIKPYDNLIR